MNLNHRRFFYFCFFTLLLSSLNISGQSVQVGLLDLTVKNNETNLSRIRSCRHILQVAGITFHESAILDTVLQYPVVLVSPVILSGTFTSAEKLKLSTYVQNGGVLIASSMRDPALYNLFGVTNYATHTDLKRLYWQTEVDEDYFDRIDDPLEKVVSLADSSETFTEAFNIRSYTLAGGAESLAHYDNSLNAVVHNEFGSGHTFLLGLDLRDVIMRNLINSDLNAHRTYSNGFEPTTDSFIFFITNIIRKHTEHAVRLHTCPDCGSGVVMVTHDIDSRTAMDTMSVFAEYEQAFGINSMYNITTRYFADSWMTAFYPISLDKVENVKNLGQRIASHSVGHFPDYYNTTTFPLTTTGNTPVDYQPRYYNSVTTGGNVYGEVEVSKYLLESNHNVQVKSFRAGHLAFNPRLPKALQDLGYLYNSTFSANDVLTNFPFFDIDELKFSGAQTNVLEIPMTISDASASIPFNQDNYTSYAQNWINITQKNLANNAPTVLLIHPNRHYKLLAEQQYVNGLGTDVKYMFLDDFGAYWKDRLTAQIKTHLSNDTLYVTWLNFLPQSDLSLVIDDVNELDAVRFFDGMGQEMTAEFLAASFGETRFCHFEYVSGTEICNGVDDNNNGLIDEDLKFSQFLDQDQDGYGNAQISEFACELLEGYVANGEDCNDENTVIHPNNIEFCDSLDNDCNGIADDGLIYGDYYQDLDQDGFGQSETLINSCNQPFGFVAQDGDCNDWVNGINPSEIEICNDIDDNCNNEIDEGLLFEVYYEDLDADGIGNSEVSVIKCVLPFGFVAQHGDCQDNNANVNPNSGEQCGNGIDDNCNGEIDEGCVVDLDDDGYTNAEDCDDDNSLINPGATEVCNEWDDNCDGLIDESLTTYFYYADFDGDGFGTNSVGYVSCWMMDGFVLDNTDCDDDNAGVNPNMTEVCGNEVDEDCDGFVSDGLNFPGVSPVSVMSALYPTCTGLAVKSANLNLGQMEEIDEKWGKTLWFSFVAQYNSIRVGLSAAQGNNIIYLFETGENGCVTIVEEENEITAGNQTLINDQLQVGRTYWVAIQNLSGISNASAKVCFNHLIGSSVDHYFSNNTGVYSSVCSSVKAVFRPNASQYQFRVVSAEQSGDNMDLSPWTYTTTGNSSVVARLGSLLPVNQTGTSIQYNVMVPVVYQLSDAANNIETIVASSTGMSTIVLQSESLIDLRLSDRCPVSKELNSYIRPNRTICGASGYEWEFTQLMPVELSPIVVEGGVYASVFMVNNIPGVGVGKVYGVRVRSLHSSGIKGEWGAVQCLRIGAAGMVIQSENQNESVASMESRVSSISIYPNPTATGSFVLQYNGSGWGEWIFAQEPTPESTSAQEPTTESISAQEPTTSDLPSVEELKMMDITGKVVYQQQVVLNGNPVEVQFGNLASGVYVVMVGEKKMRLIVE